jgi:hypothetical protein
MRPARSAQQAQLLPLEDRCLLGLFTGNSREIHDSCVVLLLPPYDDIIPVDDSTAVLVAASADTAHITCNDGTHKRLDLVMGITRIDLRPDCSITSRAGMFYSAAHPPETRAIQVAAPDWLSGLQRTLRDTANTAFPALDMQLPRLQHDFSRVHRLLEEHAAAGKRKLWLALALLAAGLLLVSGVGWAICCCFAQTCCFPWQRAGSYTVALAVDEGVASELMAVPRTSDPSHATDDTTWPEEGQLDAVPRTTPRARRLP